jgi:hypothetical protein
MATPPLNVEFQGYFPNWTMLSEGPPHLNPYNTHFKHFKKLKFKKYTTLYTTF